MPFIQGALFATLNGGSDLARDIQSGFLNRLALTPMTRVGADRRAPRRRRRPGPAAGRASTSRSGWRSASGLAAGVFGAGVLLLLAALIALGFGALGTFVALRTGSGEATQATFPIFFVFLFISSMNTPRNLIQVDWFRTRRRRTPSRT